jgi:hypothetical protein
VAGVAAGSVAAAGGVGAACAAGAGAGAGDAAGAGAAEGSTAGVVEVGAAGWVTGGGGEGTCAGGCGTAGGAGAVAGGEDGAGGWPGCAAGPAGSGAGEAIRAGSNVSGSTYPWSSEVTRIPRYTYGSGSSGAPLVPTVATTAPSTTESRFLTRIEPRCCIVAVYPSAVLIESVLPPVGTVPANDTTPDTGASTSEPRSPATSMPRC